MRALARSVNNFLSHYCARATLCIKCKAQASDSFQFPPNTSTSLRM